MRLYFTMRQGTFEADEIRYTLCSGLAWSHYRLILPTEEERKAELEREKRLILEQKGLDGIKTAENE